MSEIVEKIQISSSRTLTRLLQESLEGVERQVVDQIGGFLALSEKRDELITSFITFLGYKFDELLDKESQREERVFDYESLALVQEEELDVMVALEGMVNASRNEHLPNFISFNTRLNALFPRKRIDETSNPLDPDQIATAFQEALRPLSLDAQNTLAIYRAFNRGVLKNLDPVLSEANKILIDNGVIPNLGMESPKKKEQAASRTSRRRDPVSAFGTVEEEEFDDADRPELFSMMQNLMHRDEQPTSPAPNNAGTGQKVEIPEGHVVVPADQAHQYMVPSAMVPADQAGQATMQPFAPADNQQVQMVDQAKLMEILSNIQQSLSRNEASSADDGAVNRIDISESLGQVLSATQPEGVVNAVDRQSSDVINLVTLLYEAIWNDESVPIPIKELIGRTQITIIKVALSDTTFFNRENHPARAILNEFAAAGIGWMEVEQLEGDPLYKKIQETVEKILTDYTDDNAFFEDLVTDFKKFRSTEAARSRTLEQSILKAKERKERLDDIHELVTQKIAERVLGREIHPFVETILTEAFHKFMVMLVLKEGPGSNAWKQAINTIDVLLWSVQTHDQAGDHDRLEMVNPRLLNNLRKAFRIASIDPDEINTLISQLKNVQDDTFTKAPEIATVDEPEILPLDEAYNVTPAKETSTEPAASIDMPEADQDIVDDEPDPEHIEQVEAMTVGIWVEFVGEDEQNTRCKLAAKINAIDKFIFVNRQGVKVVEKTTTGLAKELKEGTVRIISDGLLFSRALESVIGNLRDTQHEQQTGSAYQPTAQ